MDPRIQPQTGFHLVSEQRRREGETSSLIQSGSVTCVLFRLSSESKVGVFLNEKAAEWHGGRVNIFLAVF